MRIVLDTNNVFTYLARLKYCTDIAKDTSKTLIISAKNFNIAIEFADGRHLLVKQELFNNCGESQGEFWSAWRVKQLVDRFPKLGDRIGSFLPELLYFDPESSILIVNYLHNYSDLYRYYLQENQFPIEIASAIGQFLATLHAQAFQQPDYQQFLERGLDPDTDRHIDTAMTATDIIYRLNRVTPQVFHTMPIECLQFYKLYQRFPSLTRAIADLGKAISPSCVIHNDLKLNNILLDSDWQSDRSQVIRVIDWERASWGDPAFDLGCILGSYLEIWLDGLAISKMLSIEESLQLATTPLELLQPSLFSLVQSYLAGFPAILATRPDFLDRAIQFAGLALIQRIEISIDDRRTFGDRGIMMLQVAKQLLSTPQAAMKTLFNCDFDRLVSC